MPEHYDRIDQWLDWGDHTVTIDPIGNKPWIHEGQEGKHNEATERGRAYDAADVKHMNVQMNHGHITANHGICRGHDLRRGQTSGSR